MRNLFKPLSEKAERARFVSRERWRYFSFIGRLTHVQSVYQAIVDHPMSTDETKALAQEVERLQWNLQQSMKTRKPM